MKKLKKQLKREFKSIESQIVRPNYVSILAIVAVTLAATNTCSAAHIV